MGYHFKDDSPACTPEIDYGAFWMEGLGLDLSGSLQGAGGIGGLLSETRSDGTYFAFADGNGNVSEYLDTNGTVQAHYEYDPYGNVTVATGSDATEFNYGFSTKYWDRETGLGYWGMRYYSAGQGRWLGRDPIEQSVLTCAYTFCVNAPIHFIDLLGMLNIDYSVTAQTRTSWIKQWYVEQNYTCTEQKGTFNWVADYPPATQEMFKLESYTQEDRDRIQGFSITLPSGAGSITAEIINGIVEIFEHASSPMPPVEIRPYTYYKNTGYFSMNGSPTWKTTFSMKCDCHVVGLEDYLEEKKNLEYVWGDWE